MYRVTIQNGNNTRIIHDNRAASNSQKLSTASIVDAVNSISSFTFTINPANAGYDSLHEYTTMVTVRNVDRNRNAFVGRVLQISPSMDSDGMITKTVVCESRLGYLQDSIQPYEELRHYEGDATRSGLEEFIDLMLEKHNAQVEEHKRIKRGTVTVDPFETSDSVTKGLNWETTYDCIMNKLVGSFGGYILLREGNDGLLYLDYLKSVGETRSTTFEIGRNITSASKEIDATGIITRLVPLGAKIKVETEDGQTTDSEERLTIEAVNDGVKYIEATDYLKEYGIKYGTVEFDDVTDATNLLRKGQEFLEINNGLYVSHDIEVLDLSLIGLDIDDIELYDRYPVKNVALGVDDTLQIIEKETDVIEPYLSTFEAGSTKKSLSASIIEDIANTTEKVTLKVESSMESIRQTIYSQAASLITSCEGMIATALETYVSTGDLEEFRNTIASELQIMADGITAKFTEVTEEIESVDGDLQTKYSEYVKYIKASDDGIIIGSSENAITLQLDNEEGIVFSKNGTPFGRWDGENFFTGNIVIEVNERAQFGNFAYVPRTDGSLSFLKVSG